MVTLYERYYTQTTDAWTAALRSCSLGGGRHLHYNTTTKKVLLTILQVLRIFLAMYFSREEYIVLAMIPHTHQQHSYTAMLL